MDLYEYQGRSLLARHDLPVLDGGVATTAAQAEVIAERLGGRVVVKAQVKAGGRGKAGGVKLAATAAEARARASDILGMDINGHTVAAVLVTTAVDITAEYYVSYLLDRASRSFLCIASVAGGMDIEQVARQTPERVTRVGIDPERGVDEAVARQIVDRAGFSGTVAGQVAAVAVRLWRAFVAEDATLVEVNPLALTADGTIRCLDAKVTVDDNAAFRHPEHGEYADRATDPLERRAREKGLNYVKLAGQVGVIGNGAGLVMSTLDVVADAGEPFGVRPANFLDIGGGASAQVMADGLGIVLSDPAVRAVFVNVFGGITTCDAVADGILQALSLMALAGARLDKPLVVRLDGNSAEAGRRILDRAVHPLVERVDTMDAAARRVAELAADPPRPRTASLAVAAPAVGHGSRSSGTGA